MKVSGVPVADFADYYPQMRWAFESFAERSSGAATADDLAAQVMAQDSQCWIAFDEQICAVMLTEVRDARNRQVVITHCAGFGREDWQEALVSEVEHWAKSIGADGVAAVCRPGWTKHLRSMGFKETHRVMERSLG